MEEMKFCQSCGMILENEEVIGTNQDGNKNDGYCIYCFKDGTFTTNCTMEEMIQVSAEHMKELGILEAQNKTEEEAKEFMRSFFPTLKRWQCTCTIKE